MWEIVTAAVTYRPKQQLTVWAQMSEMDTLVIGKSRDGGRGDVRSVHSDGRDGG